LNKLKIKNILKKNKKTLDNENLSCKIELRMKIFLKHENLKKKRKERKE